MIDALLKDLRFAIRLTMRQPLLTLAAVVTVAFGVGANTAIVSVLETVLLNPLGIRDAGKVMAARVHLNKLKLYHSTTSPQEYRELQSMSDVFSGVTATTGAVWTSEVNGEAARMTGSRVTPEFFGVFGERPAMGRFFDVEDRTSVVISYAMWRTQFGSDPKVLDRTIVLDGRPFHVVGVASRSFRFPAAAQLWIPLTFAPNQFRRGYNMMFSLFARLKDGVSPQQATARVISFSNGLIAQNDQKQLRDIQYGYELDPFGVYVAGDLRRPLMLLWAAALVVLLTGCANVAGLLLTRSAGRRREIAIRLSLGATRLQVLRQLLIESLLLGALGGAAGVAMASAAMPLLARTALPMKAVLGLVSMNQRMLLYGLALSLVSGLFFGLAPAVQMLKSSQTSEMVRSRRRWFQDLFVTAEVAGALVLVVMTLLLTRSLWALEQTQLGLDPRHVTTAQFLTSRNDPAFEQRLLEVLGALPGVEASALALSLPYGAGGFTSSFNIRNRQHEAGEPEWHGEAYMVTPGYFDALRIPLVRGRTLAASDTQGAPVVCVIDTRMADRFFPNQDPLGQEIAMYQGWARVVGVVGALRDELEVSSRPAVYYSYAQVHFGGTASAVVRSKVQSTGSAIRAAVRRTNASVPVFGILSMEELIGESLGVRRVVVTLLWVFGAVSLLLASIGIYGVVAQVVSERTPEIGIRVALGAQSSQILAQFIRQGLRAGLVGVGVGLVVAAYATRWLQTMLYEVRQFDAASFGVAATVILALLITAVWWPARRASRISAQEALRHE